MTTPSKITIPPTTPMKKSMSTPSKIIASFLASMLAAIPMQAALYLDVNGDTAGFGDYAPSQVWDTSASGTNIWTTSAAGTAVTDSYFDLGGNSTSAVNLDGTSLTANASIVLQQNVTVASLSVVKNASGHALSLTAATAGSTIGIGTLTFAGTPSGGYATTIAGGNLSLVGDIVIQGGRQTYYVNIGANDYAGTATIKGGWMQYTGTNATAKVIFGAASGVAAGFVNNASTLYVGSVSSAQGDGYLSGTNVIVNQTENGSFGGRIVALALGGGFTKNGSAVLTLTGTSTYTGTTTVSAGTLLINTNLSNTSSVSVANNARIGGNGTTTGITVQAGGFLGGNNSIDHLATGPLSLQGNSTVALELNITNATTVTEDTYNVTGNFSLDAANTVVLTLSNLGSDIKLNNGTKLTLVNYSGTWNGGKLVYLGNVLDDQEEFVFGANRFAIDYNGANDLTLLAVPEPTTFVMVALGLLLVVLGRRRCLSVRS